MVVAAAAAPAAAAFAAAGTRIDNGMWEQNNDDGWYHVTLPFDFNWFGATERIITIGTNGVLTFGTAQLPYGSSEPVRDAVVVGASVPSALPAGTGAWLVFARVRMCMAAHDSVCVDCDRCRARMVTCRATEMTTRPTARCPPRVSLLPSGQI